MLCERDRAELPGRVRDGDAPRLHVRDLGVVDPGAEHLPQPDSGRRARVDLILRRVAPLVDHDLDAGELLGERLLRVEDRVYEGAVGGGPEVGEPRLDVPLLDDVKDVAQRLPPFAAPQGRL